MKKHVRKLVGAEEPSGLKEMRRRIGLGELVLDLKADLSELVQRSGTHVLAALLEEEMIEVCGVRYARKRAERLASRWGEERGELVLGGRKINVAKPRARRAGKEVTLKSYEHYQQEDPLNDRAMEQMLIGVSTRKYARSLEAVGRGQTQSSVSKSEVSRRFVQMTQAKVNEVLARPLGDRTWAAVMIDGIGFAEHVIVVVLGIDSAGEKQVLGLREGSTENATLCRELLGDLVERGLPADKSLLVVIDGGKGLRKAVTQVFANHAQVQRCQEHKKRNVLEHLPEVKRPRIKAALQQAYGAESHELALKQLHNLVRTLANDYPGAAASLEEGLEETLTVKKLGVPALLAKTLSTTNPIENMNGSLRRVSRRVRRWGSGKMALRWAVAGAVEAEKGFKRLKGYREMPILLAALAQNDKSNKTDVRAEV